MKNRSSRVFSAHITKEKAKDSGLAAVLLLLIIGWVSGDDIFLKVAVGALLLDMTFPMAYYPFAVLWFGLSDVLGAIVSKVLLTLVYLIVLLPVALVRRGMGKDPLLLRRFRKDRGSVMVVRNKIFGAEDMEKPF